MKNSDKIEKAAQTINVTYKRVLVDDYYEDYELKKLIESLQYLLDEANKK